MAFLNFLKKTNKDMPSKFDLDVPPPPPFGIGGDSFPEMQDNKDPFNNSQGFTEKKPFSSNQQFSTMQDSSAPPYPTPPGMPSFQEPPKFDTSKKQEVPSPNFSMQSFESSLKSPGDLGLDMPSEDDFGKFPTFDSPPIPVASNTEQTKVQSQQLQQSSLDFSPNQNTQVTPIMNNNNQTNIQTAPLPLPKPMEDAPKFDYESLMKDMQTKQDAQNAKNINQSEMEIDDELEAPPTPTQKIKPNYEMFGREIREAQTQSKRRVPSGPLFVTMSEFKEVLEKSDFVKAKLKEASDTLDRVGNIESSINEQYDKWRRDIAELQKKFLLVDKKIFELEG